jgi:chromosomal replication initiator protein
MFLAKRISSNVRELEGALNRIAAYAAMQSRRSTVEFVTEVLASTLRANQRRISIDEIQTRVSEHYRIRKAEMTSRAAPAKSRARARSPCTCPSS